MATVPYSDKIAARLERGETVLWAQSNSDSVADTNPVRQWISGLPNSVRAAFRIFFSALPFLIILGFLYKDFSKLPDLFRNNPEGLYVIAGFAAFGGLCGYIFKTYFTKQGTAQMSSMFFEHNIITNKRILFFNESGPAHSLTQKDIKSAEFDWENGARVLRLLAKSPLQNVVLARMDIERAMQLVQQNFLRPTGKGAA